MEAQALLPRCAAKVNHQTGDDEDRDEGDCQVATTSQRRAFVSPQTSHSRWGVHRVLDIQNSILTLDDRKDEFRLSEPPHTEDVDRACADTDGSRVRSLVIRLTTTTPSGSASLGRSKYELMATLRTLESQKVRRRPAAVISTGTEIALV